jgi:hypothetical protein
MLQRILFGKKDEGRSAHRTVDHDQQLVTDAQKPSLVTENRLVHRGVEVDVKLRDMKLVCRIVAEKPKTFILVQGLKLSER